MAGALPQGASDAHMVAGSGYSKEFTGGFSRRYDDGTLRAYIPFPSAPPRQIWKLVYTDISKDQFEDLEEFWEDHANEATLAAASFTFTHPVTGATLTGIFVTEGRRIDPQITASCRYSFDLVVEVIPS